MGSGDGAVSSDGNAHMAKWARPRVERIGSAPPLPPEVLKSTTADARAALAARDYPKAIALLTKLQRQAEFPDRAHARSEEHTSELQSRLHLVCRLLLEKKKNYSNERKATRLALAMRS